MNENITRIIEVANELLSRGRTGASTGEKIAGVFVINRMDLLPDSYSDVIEAWDRLDDWQKYVRVVKSDYMHLINLPIEE